MLLNTVCQKKSWDNPLHDSGRVMPLTRFNILYFLATRTGSVGERSGATPGGEPNEITNETNTPAGTQRGERREAPPVGKTRHFYQHERGR